MKKYKKEKIRVGDRVFTLVKFLESIGRIGEARRELAAIGLWPEKPKCLEIIVSDKKLCQRKWSIVALGRGGRGKYVEYLGCNRYQISWCSRGWSFHANCWFLCRPLFPGVPGPGIIVPLLLEVMKKNPPANASES